MFCINFLINKTKELFPASQTRISSAEGHWGPDHWWNPELLQELVLLSQPRVVQRLSLHWAIPRYRHNQSHKDLKESQNNLSEDVLHSTKMQSLCPILEKLSIATARSTWLLARICPVSYSYFECLYPLQNSFAEILTLNGDCTVGGTFGKCLRYEAGALLSGVSAL